MEHACLGHRAGLMIISCLRHGAPRGRMTSPHSPTEGYVALISGPRGAGSELPGSPQPPVPPGTGVLAYHQPTVASPARSSCSPCLGGGGTVRPPRPGPQRAGQVFCRVWRPRPGLAGSLTLPSMRWLPQAILQDPVLASRGGEDRAKSGWQRRLRGWPPALLDGGCCFLTPRRGWV